MPKLELDEEELDLVKDLLEREAEEVREEIQRTDDAHYRDEIEEEEKMLIEIVRKLKKAEEG